MRLHFGEFVLDSARRELRRSGGIVRISPKALRFLELLIAERSRALSKSEIRQHVWPAVSVSEASFARLAKELRTALDDDAREPRFVRTVHGFGYAFLESVVEEPAPGSPSHFRLVWGNRGIPLVEGENRIGRAGDATVSIDSIRVSRHHARITVSGGEAVLEDLGSKNGTFVGGRRIDRPMGLTHGDEIGVGPALLVFHRGPLDADTTEAG